jgi:hypothetical protein
VAQDPEQRRIREEMAVQGVDYQFVRSEDINPTATTCELIEVTTALACASASPDLAVQVKTGIGRFFNDLTKAPYKAIFNSSVTGAHAFNSTVMLRLIDGWIERKKRMVTRRSGVRWGVLIHGNRILGAAVFKKFGPAALSKPIGDFSASLNRAQLDALCEDAYEKIVKTVETKYPSKFLAVLFKNPSMSKRVYDAAVI